MQILPSMAPSRRGRASALAVALVLAAASAGGAAGAAFARTLPASAGAAFARTLPASAGAAFARSAAPTGSVAEATPATPPMRLAAKPARLDLNSATAEQLVELPGIGAARAQAILAMRDERGGFRSVEELLEVKGIGPKALEKLRPLLTLGRATP